ncbi:hypothetical protein [Sphingomonas sp. LT1P40]|uniref:hypothetical protein n=1 Tax=Alteristakelama amylovorans TaxID=3096166 RepID=UPI002FCA95D2
MMREASDGLAEARKRRNRLHLIIALLMGVGGVIGFMSAMLETKDGAFLEGIPAEWAIAASVMLVVAIGFGGWRYNLATDELDRRDSYWASAMALNVYLIAYPVWYLWWRGGLMSEPSHQTMFVITFLAMAASYGYKKIKP